MERSWHDVVIMDSDRQGLVAKRGQIFVGNNVLYLIRVTQLQELCVVMVLWFIAAFDVSFVIVFFSGRNAWKLKIHVRVSCFHSILYVTAVDKCMMPGALPYVTFSGPFY